jgi:hypothetical protein
MACARTLEGAVAQAQRRAEMADLHKSYAGQALSCAEDEAAAKEDEASNDTNATCAVDLSEVPTDQLIAEIHSRGLTARE